MMIDDSTKANTDVKGMHKVKSGNTDDRKFQVDMCSVFHLRSTNAEKKSDHLCYGSNPKLERYI